MLPLHRHQLASLSVAGWAAIRARPWDAQARACIDHWAAHRLPLVVTRQAAADSGVAPSIALGLPAPTVWGRRRLALDAPYQAIAWFDEFPPAGLAERLLARESRLAWRGLCRSLASCGARARVYGSHGWQLATGLAYLREGSDMDLWITVEDALQADAVAAALAAFDASGRPRLDGELVFADGAAIAWREWKDWRAGPNGRNGPNGPNGRARRLLVKRLDGACLADAAFIERYRQRQEIAA